MALRRDLAKRLFHLRSGRATAAQPPLPDPSSNAARSGPRRNYLSSPDAACRGFFQRFLQRRAINQASLKQVRLPQFLAMPIGESLREKLRETRTAPGHAGMETDAVAPAPMGGTGGLTVENVRRIVRLAQVETVKERLRSATENTVAYAEYVRICVDACRSETQGLEMAKLLDDSANVVVWGNVVFLRPEQLTKSMETLILETVGQPNYPRKKELDQMETQKAQIDEEARSLVRRELYIGLGLLVAQNVGFMRLTFWELSWDVMEPICFFVTSIHFALAYVFFLRTSTEPSFEGYFKRRFRTKQSQLMKTRNFDVDEYERLRKAFYPKNGQLVPRMMWRK